MNNKSVLAGGIAAAAIASVLLAVSSIAHGVEAPVLATTVPTPADARIHVAQAEGTKVSYTAEQATRGKEVYVEDCVECHGSDMRGGLLGGPPLRGSAFEQKYGGGSPAGVLYEVMSGTMPPNDPGRYSPGTYADLMAYILKTNAYKAGAELPSDIDALYNLVIQK
jgi:mono/diheme cytochrome c family protein